MLVPVIDWDICQACQPCLARGVCKTRAITKIDPDEPPYIAYERCSSCAACVLACCCEAIVMSNSSTSTSTINPVSGRL
jgi:Fe-S-cluster-containing hydrogenase component 2